MDWDLVLSSIWPLLDGAVRGTIPLALVSFVLGLVLALLAALARLSPRWWLSGIARFYISVIRGTPLIVQLYVVFFGLPSIDVVIPPWPSAILVLSLNVGGYAAEIIRAAILSIPRGQWEAAYTIGMPRWLALRRIILPQAVRVSVPPLSNTFISLVKDTALTSLILVTEMFRRAQQIAAFSNEFLLLYVEAAVLYWVICLVLSAGQGTLERRLERHVA
jgi:cystine transport system permease protein